MQIGQPNFLCCSAVFHPAASLVKRRVAGVEILAVQMLLRNAEGIAEALIVNDLALTEILDGIAHVGIVGHTQNIVVGDTRLLLC